MPFALFLIFSCPHIGLGLIELSWSLSINMLAAPFVPWSQCRPLFLRWKLSLEYSNLPYPQLQPRGLYPSAFKGHSLGILEPMSNISLSPRRLLSTFVNTHQFKLPFNTVMISPSGESLILRLSAHLSLSLFPGTVSKVALLDKCADFMIARLRRG